MSAKWYKVGVKYYPIDPETGEAKAKTEHFLIEAVGFTDAEFIANEKLSDLLRQQGEVVSMERKQYGYLIKGIDEQQYFETKIEVVEDGAKVQKNTVLFAGYGFTEALNELEENLKREYSNYKVSKMQESGIVQILPFEEENVLHNKALKLESGLEGFAEISFFRSETVNEETGEVTNVFDWKPAEGIGNDTNEASETQEEEKIEIPEKAVKKYGLKTNTVRKPTKKPDVKKPAPKKPQQKKVEKAGKYDLPE